MCFKASFTLNLNVIDFVSGAFDLFDRHFFFLIEWVCNQFYKAGASGLFSINADWFTSLSQYCLNDPIGQLSEWLCGEVDQSAFIKNVRQC